MARRFTTPGLLLVVGFVGAPGCSTKKNGIYAPGPPSERLAKTQAAADGANVETKIAFCVDERAVTVDVEVVESSGYPDVDAICVETVQTWKFKAYVEDGVPTKQCSTEIFKLTFQ